MRKIKLLLLLLFIVALSFGICLETLAATPTDEILNYEITANVNEDATVNLSYHIDWKVLESDGIGPLSWVTIGIPSNQYVSMKALSSNIKRIEYSSEYGSNVKITFNDEYYKQEIVSFDFLIVQDSLYQMNLFEDGVTSYCFTPGWFEDINVDQMTIRWSNLFVQSWSPECKVIDGYNTWSKSLKAGDSFSVRVDYPNDSFAFVSTKSVYYGDNNSGNGNASTFEDVLATILGFLIFVFIFIYLPISLIRKAFKKTANFRAKTTEKKITRTKIVYYPVCQGCGAPRGDGEQVCSHCGRSYIKSEEVIKEENVPEVDKEALKYKTKGEYRYNDSPNTYVRVNVVHVPVVTHTSSSGSHRSGTSSRGGGCAHSSCACACASCACACACACAGGGRAGCSTKDFYNTRLKLQFLYNSTVRKLSCKNE